MRLHHYLILLILMIACTPAMSKAIECDGAKAEMSFVKTSKGDQGSAFIISVSRAGRTITRKHDMADFMGLECQRTSLGKELIVYMSVGGGSHSPPPNYGVIDPVDLKILVSHGGAKADVSAEEAGAIVKGINFETHTMQQEYNYREVQPRLYPESSKSEIEKPKQPKFSKRELDAANNKYKSGALTEAIKRYRDLAERGSLEAATRLASIDPDLDAARLWCYVTKQNARQRGTSECEKIIHAREAHLLRPEPTPPPPRTVAVPIDYREVKSALLDNKRAVGKTIQFNATYVQLDMNTVMDRPAMTLDVDTDTGLNYWFIFFDSSLNKRISELRKGQRLKITCKILEFGMVPKCELMTATFL